ncbi:FHA domain-containing protein [Pleionea sp. CnH1-48]|uniref:FHA domain-containing protein n=1 Tax=Pleionea sp. CnH1-48 TaxID=2954494 RepID=UPI0020969FCE|nr:FHA domain-containing protein [Pleionea sp. CnH1-48]MCO7226326.1 FHA domain-containing protein [Pleionea sp. CnH1-48]
MAYLLCLTDHSKCYLNSHHTFGRLEHSVNTLISEPDISKFHAVIEWSGNTWLIRDISKNGTYLNNKKLVPNQAYSLAIGDQLFFSQHQEQSYQVKDLSQPENILIPLDHTSTPISIKDYNLLPSNQECEKVVYYHAQKGIWLLEDINGNNSYPLDNGDVILLKNKPWQFHTDTTTQPTLQLSEQQYSINDINFVFNLSQDEEVAHLKLQTPVDDIDLEVRTHHYLTLTLVRSRYKDALKGFDSDTQGWIYTEQLEKDLGLSQSHLNIQIHRARKQFKEILSNIKSSEDIIERTRGKIRFGPAKFQLFKGRTLECQMNSMDTR